MIVVPQGEGAAQAEASQHQLAMAFLVKVFDHVATRQQGLEAAVIDQHVRRQHHAVAKGHAGEEALLKLLRGQPLHRIAVGEKQFFLEQSVLVAGMNIHWLID